MRPLCACGQRPAAVNYKKDGKTFYRKKCEICLKTQNHRLWNTQMATVRIR
jgi:hypothetical protein